MKWPSLEKVAQDARASWERFPFTLLASFCFAGVAILWVGDDIKDPTAIRWLLPASLGIPLFTGLRLAGEGWPAGSPLRWVLPVLGIVLVVLYGFFLPAELREPDIIRYFMSNASAHLLVAFAAFGLRRGTEAAFWQFNSAIFLRFLTAVFFSHTLYAGLAAAAAATDALFELQIPERIYAYLYFVVMGVFNTWYFLGGVPTQAEELDGKHRYPAGLKVFTQYILVPLVSLYWLILYAYTAKILFSRALPVGWVSYWILFYAFFGMLTSLLLHPIREAPDSAWVRVFSRGYHSTLLPLMILLAVAIGVRIDQYGMTEKRYLVVLLGVWITLISFYLLATRQRSLRAVPISLAAVLVLTSLGPWGAAAVSRESQVRRLQALLKRHELPHRADRTVEIPWEDEKEFSAVINYIHGDHGPQVLQARFPDLTRGLEIEDSNGPRRLVESLGLTYLTEWEVQQAESERRFQLQTVQDRLVNVDGFQYVYDLDYVNFGTRSRSHRETILPGGLEALIDDGTARLTFEGRELEPLSFDLGALVRRLDRRAGGTGAPLSVEETTLDAENQSLHIRLVVSQLYGEEQRDGLRFNQIRAKVLIRFLQAR